MTEQLKTMMDRAADQDFAAVDLDAITGAADRAVRRGRVATGLAGVAALAVVAAGAVLLGGDGGDDKTDFVETPFRTDVPMWTDGSTLHTPDATYDLGVQVVALTRTSAGVAYVGADQSVNVFAGGDHRRIGSISDETEYTLVGDSDGTRVGWVDATGAKPVFVAYDFATGAEARFDQHTHPGMDGDEPPNAAYFFAIDGNTAYWLDARGTVATDLDSGQSEVLRGPNGPTFVIDAEDGTVVNFIESAGGEDLGTEVVAPDGRVLLGHRDTDTLGRLSPDARWAVSYDSASVWEIGTGRQTLIEVPDAKGDVIGYEWLDDSRFMVLAESDDDSLRLLECRVPDVTCTDVALLDLTDEGGALPGTGLLFGLGVTPDEAEATASSTSSTDRPE